MAEILSAPDADLTLSDDMMTNASETVPFGCDDDNPQSDEAFETTPQIRQTAAPKRGRGKPPGPSLKQLLTQHFADGATAEELVAAGFLGDLSAALEREDIRQLDGEGRYVWMHDSATDGATAAAPSGQTAEEQGHASFTRTEVLRSLEDPLEINIASIPIGDRCRELSQKWVRKLADSMSTLGLQNPVTVVRDGNGFVLVAGRHRLEAAKLLGWEKIPCAVVRMDDLTRGLWEVDENLCRAELTELERGEHLAQRREIYHRPYPEAWQHVSGAVAANARNRDASANLAVASFPADTAAKTGLSERSIERAVHRAEHIASEVRAEIRQMPQIADKGVELDALAKTTPAQQLAAVAAVKSGDAPTVRAAVASLGLTKTSRPTGRAASNSDKRIDSIMQRIWVLNGNDRETLWDTLADHWHEEMSRELAGRLLDIAEVATPPTDPTIN